MDPLYSTGECRSKACSQASVKCCRLVQTELRSGARTVETVMSIERQRIEAALPKKVRLVVLDEHGKDWTTMHLAQALPRWQQDGLDVAFVIGVRPMR